MQKHRIRIRNPEEKNTKFDEHKKRQIELVNEYVSQLGNEGKDDCGSNITALEQFTFIQYNTANPKFNVILQVLTRQTLCKMILVVPPIEEGVKTLRTG